MGKKAKLGLAGLASIIFTYYILTSILSDAAYIFAPGLYDTLITISGFLALLFIILTFFAAIKEKDIPILLLFVLLFVVIAGGIIL